jgi:outer membrane protein insertion porin family
LGNTAELQSAIPGVPNEYGLRAAAFVDAGSVFGYSESAASLQVVVQPLRFSAGGF